MKNLASRVLALIIVLSVFLMPMSAMAAERNAAMLTVGNLELSINGESLTLPLYLQIGGGVDLENERGFVSANLSTANAAAISAVAALENAEVKAYLNGMSYGLSIPLEQITAIIESAMQSSGVSIEELMGEMQSSVSPEMQAAIDKLTAAMTAMIAESEAAVVDPADLSTYWTDVLGATVEVTGEAEATTIFDVEVQAVPMTVTVPQMTYNELMNKAFTAAPSAKEFYDAYIELFNLILAEAGEEGVDSAEIEEIMGMISFGMNGIIKQAEEGYSAELTMTMTISDGEESESLDLPMTILGLTDEAGIYNAVVVDMDVDGENLYMTVYTDDYAADGYDYTNCEITMSIGDTDAEVADGAFVINLYSVGNEAEGTTYGVDLYVEDYGTPLQLGGLYHAYPAVLTDANDSYSGYLYVYGGDETMSLEAAMDTNLQLTSVPTGELLHFDNSINPLEADEAALEQLGTDAMTVLYQGLGILMSDPDVAALINSFAE